MKPRDSYDVTWESRGRGASYSMQAAGVVVLSTGQINHVAVFARPQLSSAICLRPRAPFLRQFPHQVDGPPEAVSECLQREVVAPRAVPHASHVRIPGLPVYEAGIASCVLGQVGAHRGAHLCFGRERNEEGTMRTTPV